MRVLHKYGERFRETRQCRNTTCHDKQFTTAIEYVPTNSYRFSPYFHTDFRPWCNNYAPFSFGYPIALTCLHVRLWHILQYGATSPSLRLTFADDTPAACKSSLLCFSSSPASELVSLPSPLSVALLQLTCAPPPSSAKCSEHRLLFPRNVAVEFPLGTPAHFAARPHPSAN